MNINLYTTNENQPYKFTPELGISFLNIAVNNSPYRTGNLRRSIILQQNGPKIKRIIYKDSNAYYLNYLEEGQGRNKMHKGFISIDTTNDILKETYEFLLTGEVTYNKVPTIMLKTDRARNYERKLLEKNNISINKRLTAFDRATLSRMYVRENGLDASKNSSSKNKSTIHQKANANNKLFYGSGELRGK